MQKSGVKGIIYALITAIAFSLGGIFTKVVPWQPMSIQGIRSIFALIALLIYMKVIHHPFRLNKTVILGGICGLGMGSGYIMATKLTTAANAVVLQCMEPVWIILFLWIIWKKRPKPYQIITILLTFGGTIFFFLDSLSPGNMLGNIIAILSGIAYAGLVLNKSAKEGDLESSLVVSYVLSIAIGLFSFRHETEFSVSIWIIMILFGVVQYAMAYMFLSRSLDLVSPVTASVICMLEPVLNPILVAIFYGEKVGPMALIGAVLVLGSITYYSVREAKCVSSVETG